MTAESSEHTPTKKEQRIIDSHQSEKVMLIDTKEALAKNQKDAIDFGEARGKEEGYKAGYAQAMAEMQQGTEGSTDSKPAKTTTPETDPTVATQSGGETHTTPDAISDADFDAMLENLKKTKESEEGAIATLLHEYITKNTEKGAVLDDIYGKLNEKGFSREQIVDTNIYHYVKENHEKFEYQPCYEALYKQKYTRDEIVDTNIQHYLRERPDSYTYEMLEKALLDVGYTQEEIEKNKSAFIPRESDKKQTAQTAERTGMGTAGGAATAPAIETGENQPGTEGTLPEPAAEAPRSVRDEYISFVQKYIEDNLATGASYEDIYNRLSEAKVSRPIIVEGNISKSLAENHEKYGYPILYMELYAQNYERKEIIDVIIRDYLKANAAEHTARSLGNELVSKGFTPDEVTTNYQLLVSGGLQFRQLQENEIEGSVPAAFSAPSDQAETIEQVLSGTTDSTSRVNLGKRFFNFFQNLRRRIQPEVTTENVGPEPSPTSEPEPSSATNESTTVESEPQAEREPVNLEADEIFGQIPKMNEVPEFIHPEDRLPDGSVPTPEGKLQTNFSFKSDFKVGEIPLIDQSIEEIESTIVPAYEEELIRINNEISGGNAPDRDIEEVRSDLNNIREYLQMRKDYEKQLP